jgi:hypothetical protein
MKSIQPSTDINWSFSKIGIETNYSGDYPLKTPSAEQVELLVNEHRKTSAYSPMLHNTVGLDSEAFYRLALSLPLMQLEDSDELTSLVSKAAKVQPFPYKIWHAVDDDAVPIGEVRMYKMMVDNGGGLCYLREFPSGCGGHHAVDDDAKAPTTMYKCSDGDEMNIPVAYAELVDWFNQW